jgi:hypothetical protein
MISAKDRSSTPLALFLESLHGIRARRPAALGVEHRTEIAESVRLAIRESFTGRSGLTPAQVAERVLAAIRTRQFWIITHRGERPVFEARVNDILANYPA